MSFFFSFFFFFVFSLSSTWERERGIRRNSFKVYLSLDDFPMENIFLSPFFFLYSRVDGIYFIFGVWLEGRVPFLTCPRYFRLSFPGVLACASPHLVTMSDPRLTFFLPTSADGRSSHFRPRAPANHLASLFFSLVRRFVRATICHLS